MQKSYVKDVQSTWIQLASEQQKGALHKYEKLLHLLLQQR